MGRFPSAWQAGLDASRQERRAERIAAELKPLEPLLPGETRSEYLDRLERTEVRPGMSREQFLRWLGSFPMHDDDRGPDNTVLIDLLPAGNDFGESALNRLADAILATLQRS